MLETRMTFVNTFWIIERQRPAIMSWGSFPFLCSVTMELVIKTVQRLPKTAGLFDSKAAAAMSCTFMPSVSAKFCKKLPQPEEQASFTRMLVMIPPLSQMAFMSWPPMSRIKSASPM